MVLILSLAGLGAFLCSAALLHGGLENMMARYFIAAAIGYALFLFLIRLWLEYQRRRWSFELDFPDVDPGSSSSSPSFSGGGGSFGGGGATGSYHPSPGSSVPGSVPEASSNLADSVPDLDEAWPVVLGLVALLAGLTALGYLIYASPVLFAEALLDAAVVGAVYRRTRRRPRDHWLRGVLRRTWLPAAAICAFVGLIGFSLQAAAPGASSLGAAVRSRGERR
jgi:hypothetical protein